MFPEEQDCDLDSFITSNCTMIMKNHNLRNRGKGESGWPLGNGNYGAI